VLGFPTRCPGVTLACVTGWGQEFVSVWGISG
jgi:hypothetical protein